MIDDFGSVPWFKSIWRDNEFVANAFRFEAWDHAVIPCAFDGLNQFSVIPILKLSHDWITRKFNRRNYSRYDGHYACIASTESDFSADRHASAPARENTRHGILG